jgi:hypothetical protein
MDLPGIREALPNQKNAGSDASLFLRPLHQLFDTGKPMGDAAMVAFAQAQTGR